MTRETKIGMVVGCSFLCLVGIVVASKWRRGDDPSEEQGAPKVAAITPTTKANEPPKKNDADKKIAENPPSAPPMPPPLPGLSMANAEAKSQAQILQEIKDAKAKADATNQSGVGPVTLAPATTASSDPATVPLPNPFANAQPIAVDPSKTTTVPAPIAPPAPVAAVEFPMPNPLDPAGDNRTGPAIPAPENVKPMVGPVDVVLPAFPPQTKDAVPSSPKDGLPAFPAPAPENGPALPAQAKNNSPPLPAQNTPKEMPTIPPINDSAKLPPIVVGGNNPPLPAVRDSKLDVYECKAGESTFAILSQRLYGTDKYADALLAYNRGHSGAVKNGSYLNVNPPVLNPGQQVLHPSKDVLERDYRQLIREASVTPSVPNSNQPPTVKISPPAPLNPGVATIANPPAIGGGRNYVVQNAGGESILDIAERVLGNRGRWSDIYRLNQSNPAVQPQFRIPAGTELKMPAN